MLQKSQAQYSNSLISVAFGAPHICDEKGALNINANKTLRWRFKNFVNQSDPVPCLLHSVANTLAKFTASLESNEIFRESSPLEDGVIPLVKFMDAVLRRDVRLAFFGAFDIGTAGFVDKSKLLIAPLLKELTRRAAPEPGSSKYNESDFYPIGYYTFIVEKQADERRNTDLQRYLVYTIDHERSHMTRKLKDVRLRFQDWEHHKLENYKTVLMESDLIDSPQVNSQQPHDCQANNVVSTPAPIITEIQLDRADSTQPFRITITGDNLLFLSEPLKINEMKWETAVQEDQRIIALGPSSSSISTETIPSVVVNTAFGKCSKIIMERSQWYDS
ncbi:hypothetical protein CY35_11G048800 [Sphagnum magellanicum]|nr:hypothetical protein CY35_11G048800 [Sphagnum magellanicum]